MSSSKERDSLMTKETQPDADLELQQTMPQLMHRLFVSLTLSPNLFPIAYERMVCKAPDSFKIIAPAAFPEDVPLSIAITSDEYDPWTETSHKFRIYEDPILTRCEPCEVEVGTISEILVWADENS